MTVPTTFRDKAHWIALGVCITASGLGAFAFEGQHVRAQVAQPASAPASVPDATCCSDLSAPNPGGYVPITAITPSALAEAGLAFSPATTVSPAVSFAQAVSLLQTCTPWGSQHISPGAGLAHVDYLFQNDPSNLTGHYSANVWAFSQAPFTSWGAQRGGTLWTVWTIDATTGECDGVSYSPGTATSGGPPPNSSLP